MSKRGKKNESGSSEKSVKETKPKKSPKKKSAIVEDPIIQEVSIAEVTPVEPTIVEETQKEEIIPLKTGVFRRLKMKSHYLCKSSPNVVCKPQVTHQGVLIREVPTPVSLSLKKRKAEDMAKHLSKKKKKKSRNLVITNESTEEDERIPETPNLDLIKELSTPEQTSIIPPEVSNVKSSNEATRTLDITVHVSNMDTNVNMGEEDPKDDIQGNPISTTFETFVSLPPQISTVTSTTDSPTFEHIINQPFTSIFSSQSTDPPKSISPIDETILMETDTDNKGFGGTFETLAFDDNEADFLDHMLMTMK
ncbi:unnamed protein product [Lactuca saligna]|uniref:Uncharacterized protein n=1 Tax=Lactuca saligna TaxID=75948 RepID=A0AA35YZG5_LACSI|nr:unnamed protein product [Lactuca saligna]